MGFEATNKRHILRLHRKADHAWQLRVGNDELITKNIANISPTGMSFKAPMWSNFHEGDKLRFNVCLNKEECFECEGKVVWARKVEDEPGAMQQLGIQFLKLPARIDSRIMKEINDTVLLDRRMLFRKGTKTPAASTRALDGRSILTTFLGLFFLASLVAALVMATYIHQQEHPEDTLSYKLDRAFEKRNLTHRF